VRHNTGSSSAAAFGQAAFTDAFDDSWAVPQEQRTKFKAFFQQLDPRQTGYVSGMCIQIECEKWKPGSLVG
jgi:hypothetical protein